MLTKIPRFAIWSSERFLASQWGPGRQPAVVRPNSGEPPTGTGRARAGEGPWVPVGRFPCSLGPGRGRRDGAPAARRGGRRGLLCRRGGAPRERRARRRACVGAREGARGVNRQWRRVGRRRTRGCAPGAVASAGLREEGRSSL
jgi:hypothetical protein